MRLGEFFSNRQERGYVGLPLMSVTMNDSLVPRDDLDRRLESALRHDQHLLVKAGDIAYNMMRMWQGACGLANEDGLVSPAYVVLAPKEGIDSRFAYHWFKSDRMIHLFWAYSHGLTEDRLRLYFEAFSEIPVHPPELRQQLRIANVLDAWDEAIAGTDRLLTVKRQLHQERLSQLIPTAVDSMSTRWRMIPLGDLGDVVNGGTPDSSDDRYWNGDIPWITPSEVSQLRRSQVADTDRKISILGLRNSSAELLPVDSLIVCTRATVGACCINSVPMATNQGFKSLKPKSNVNVRYLYHAVCSRKKELIRLANGSTFLEVTKPDFEKLRIPIPSSKDQRMIADALDEEAKEIALLEEAIDHYQLQKKRLGKLFFEDGRQLDSRFDVETDKFPAGSVS